MKTRISEIPLVGPRGRKELIKKIDGVSEDTNKKLEVLEETLGITLEPEIDEKYYQYFTIEATEDDTYLYFVNQYYVDEDKLEPLQIEVSWDDGATWTTKASENYRYDFSGQDGMPLARGEKLRIRGNNNAYGYYSKHEDTEVGRCFFWADKPCYVYGNIMSLINKDNFPRLRKLDDYAFYSLFRDSDGDENHQAFWVMSSDESDKELLLPATTIGKMCYCHLFTGSNITKAPKLPATTLATECYRFMFSNCAGLITAPSLPATTLAGYCCESMFLNCSSLTTAPELPATTLASNCYRTMFQNCTNLTAAPELPATTLAECCYSSMFQGCTSLNYIKAMFTITPSTTYTENWVSGVAANGTFVKNSAAQWDVTGVNGIPTGWVIAIVGN